MDSLKDWANDSMKGFVMNFGMPSVWNILKDCVDNDFFIFYFLFFLFSRVSSLFFMFLCFRLSCFSLLFFLFSLLSFLLLLLHYFFILLSRLSSLSAFLSFLFSLCFLFLSVAAFQNEKKITCKKSKRHQKMGVKNVTKKWSSESGVPLSDPTF